MNYTVPDARDVEFVRNAAIAFRAADGVGFLDLVGTKVEAARRKAVQEAIELLRELKANGY